MADSQLLFSKQWYKPWQLVSYSLNLSISDSYRIPINISYTSCSYSDLLLHNNYLAGRITPEEYSIILLGAAGVVKSTWIKYIYCKVIFILLCLNFVISAVMKVVLTDSYWVIQQVFFLLLFVVLMNHSDRNFIRQMGYDRIKQDKILKDFSELMLRNHGIRVKSGQYCLWIEFCRYDHYDENILRSLPSPQIIPYIPIFR